MLFEDVIGRSPKYRSILSSRKSERICCQMIAEIIFSPRCARLSSSAPDKSGPFFWNMFPKVKGAFVTSAPSPKLWGSMSFRCAFRFKCSQLAHNWHALVFSLKFRSSCMELRQWSLLGSLTRFIEVVICVQCGSSNTAVHSVHIWTEASCLNVVSDASGTYFFKFWPVFQRPTLPKMKSPQTFRWLNALEMVSCKFEQ